MPCSQSLKSKSPKYSNLPQDERSRILALLSGLRFITEFMEHSGVEPTGERVYNPLVDYVHGKRPAGDPYKELAGRSADLNRLITEGREEVLVHQIITGDDMDLGLVLPTVDVPQHRARLMTDGA